LVVDEDLLARLEQLEPQRYEGPVFRITFGSTPPERANTRGARWNPPDVAALYTSIDRETVLAEGEHLVASQPVRTTAPRRIHTIAVSLNRVLDLRSPELLANLGVTAEDLQSSDFWACRRVGEAANHLGCDGILVPSARGQGDNLVILTSNGSDTDLEVLHTESLGSGDRSDSRDLS